MSSGISCTKAKNRKLYYFYDGRRISELNKDQLLTAGHALEPCIPSGARIAHYKSTISKCGGQLKQLNNIVSQHIDLAKNLTDQKNQCLRQLTEITKNLNKCQEHQDILQGNNNQINISLKSAQEEIQRLQHTNQIQNTDLKDLTSTKANLSKIQNDLEQCDGKLKKCNLDLEEATTSENKHITGLRSEITTLYTDEQELLYSANQRITELQSENTTLYTDNQELLRKNEVQSKELISTKTQLSQAQSELERCNKKLQECQDDLYHTQETINEAYSIIDN